MNPQPGVGNHTRPMGPPNNQGGVRPMGVPPGGVPPGGVPPNRPVGVPPN